MSNWPENDPEYFKDDPFRDLPYHEWKWIKRFVGAVILAIIAWIMFVPSSKAHSWYEPVCPESSKMVDCKAERCVNISPLLTTPNVGGSSMGTPIAIQFSEKRKWGRLTPIKHVRDEFTSGGKRQPVWLFSCECGNECDVRAYAVICGSTQSCGCLAEETRGQATITHGASSGGMTPEYKTWRNMLTRGRNPNISHADRYVKRGITVADEWLPGGDGKGLKGFSITSGENHRKSTRSTASITTKAMNLETSGGPRRKLNPSIDQTIALSRTRAR